MNTQPVPESPTGVTQHGQAQQETRLLRRAGAGLKGSYMHPPTGGGQRSLKAGQQEAVRAPTRAQSRPHPSR